jgi:hypothetical protein
MITSCHIDSGLDPTSVGDRIRPSSGRRMVAGLRATAWCILVAGCLLQVSINNCAAASQSDWDGCMSQDPGKAIPACTRIVDDRNSSDGDRVDAFLWRAGYYAAQNALDSAIKDYSNAIRINPRNITALCGRAIANFRKGDREQATMDYSIAKRFDSRQLDSMMANNDDLKEIGKAASQSPVPPAQLDAAIDRMIPTVLSCPVGYRLEGASCIAISCPTGQQLNGNNCTPIVCGAGEELNGEVCVASVKYLALALGQTSRLGIGTSWNQPTMEIATDSALDRCRNQIPRGHCKIILTAENACLALSWTPTGTGWGAARRLDRGEAISASLDSCRSANHRRTCVLAGSWCNF